MVIVKNCSKCDQPFEVIVGEEWKDKCLDCWIKEKYPDSWAIRNTIIDIKCSICGCMFVGKVFQDKCSTCYRNEQQTLEDFNTDGNYNPTESEGDGY